MKITEALAKVKTNLAEIEDLKAKIRKHAARHSSEGYEYKATDPNGVEIDNTRTKVAEWIQGANQLSLDNVNLLVRIQKTNIATQLTINIGGQNITKSVAEWVWRKREYAAIDLDIWSQLTDGGRKDEARRISEDDARKRNDGVTVDVIKVVRNYDPELRDRKIASYRQEATKGGAIDVHLSISNATTDLLD